MLLEVSEEDREGVEDPPDNHEKGLRVISSESA
jgi:hypothetical protein